MSIPVRLAAWCVLLGAVVWLALRPGPDAQAAHVPPASAIPWGAVGDGGTIPRTSGPSAVLYVSAACPHCEGIARYVDSMARASEVPLVIVAPDPDRLMRPWRQRTGVRAPIREDARRAIRRALLVQYVPTLIAWNSAGVGQRAVGADRRAMGRVLRAAR